MALTSDFNFPFVTSTPFSMCFAVDIQTAHSKRTLSFLHFLIWWTGQSHFLDCFSWSFLKMEDLQLSTLHILVFYFSKTRKSMNMPISVSKKEYIYIYASLPVNVKVGLPHPRSGYSQGQETILAPSADKQTRNYDTKCSNHHLSLSILRSKELSRSKMKLWAIYTTLPVNYIYYI